MDLPEATKLALQTNYAIEAVGQEINAADAGAFFFEGYRYAQAKIQKELMKDPNPTFECAWCKESDCSVYEYTRDVSELGVIIKDGELICQECADAAREG